MPGFSSAWEKVENVWVEQVDNDVHIYYDLSGDSDKYNVTVRGSSDGGITYKLRKLNRQEGGNKYRLPTEAEWEYACRPARHNFFPRSHVGTREKIIKLLM